MSGRGLRVALLGAVGTVPAAAVGQPLHPSVVVTGERPKPAPEKLEHILPEVDGAKITVTKKTSVTKLDLVPTIVDGNPRELFARTPGLFVSEQQTRTQYNLGYRGLGNPQESEFVLVLQDGVPIATDWIGFPTVYYLPLPRSLAEVQLVRGGSSLLYGPNPAPAVNLVSKRPAADAPLSGTSENVIGSNGLFSTYNMIEGSSGSLSGRANLGVVRSRGQRDNNRSRTIQGDAYVAYRPAKDDVWYIDLHAHDASAGDAGRLSYPHYRADPDQALTPFNRNWVRRTSATLGNEADIGNGWRSEVKLWAAWQRLYQRSAAAGAHPATTTLVDEQFRSQGLDWRFRKRWGRGNALTFGTVLYHDSAPFRQWTSSEITAPRNTTTGTPRLDQDRDSWYGAIFGESVFRLPGSWHVVPSFRLEHERIRIDESVRPPNLVRPLISQSASRTIPLFGFGAGFDFGQGNETYFSVSQGYRPVRFFDVASPFSNINPGGVPAASKSVAWEAGVHGTPLKGLFYDASLFWIEFRNRIETIVLSPTESIYQNSGDTRHRGFEGELSYDFFAGREGDLHLTAFGNVSLLDAKFTASKLAARVGNRPAFAPKVTAKYGLTFRADGRFKVSVTGQSVGSQFFQDSNLPVGTPTSANFIPAKVPAVTLLDLAGDWQLTRNLRLLGGVSNLTNRAYYNRVFQNGIEPGARRTVYAGIATGF
ncbi:MULTISPECIES: TonB-dependent receptor family protein [Sphingomonas]|uniref:TonB-dependent receptor family protein n=1 Tax=Sphingomonas TaxID=13687 RepID=UPI0013B41DC0|nr:MULTISPECIES: TonB-dependent receptor [Sphingomonas]